MSEKATRPRSESRRTRTRRAKRSRSDAPGSVPVLRKRVKRPDSPRPPPLPLQLPFLADPNVQPRTRLVSNPMLMSRLNRSQREYESKALCMSELPLTPAIRRRVELMAPGRTVKGNHLIVSESGIKVIGNYNLVTGDNNEVLGNYNTVLGDNNRVRGDNTRACGHNNDVEGKYTRSYVDPNESLNKLADIAMEKHMLQQLRGVPQDKPKVMGSYAATLMIQEQLGSVRSNNSLY